MKSGISRTRAPDLLHVKISEMNVLFIPQGPNKLLFGLLSQLGTISDNNIIY